jgi:hypothetical protein
MVAEPRTMIDVINEIEKIKRIEQLMKIFFFLLYLKRNSHKVSKSDKTEIVLKKKTKKLFLKLKSANYDAPEGFDGTLLI